MTKMSENDECGLVRKFLADVLEYYIYPQCIAKKGGGPAPTPPLGASPCTSVRNPS